MSAMSGDFYTPETIPAVMGSRYDRLTNLVERTPLHINFQHSGMLVLPEVLSFEQADNRERFNAIGSANWKPITGDVVHLPVIDVDEGAYVKEYRLGSKAVLGADTQGDYDEDNELRDVLGDNGIDLEVFDEYHGRNNTVYSSVGAIVLRSRQHGAFVAFDSTQEGHSHLYIQHQFSAADHEVLLTELEKTGVISGTWLEMTQKAGSSIVRTPWTKKDKNHISS